MNNLDQFNTVGEIQKHHYELMLIELVEELRWFGI